jgi:DNA-directed RNA polymerase specialized sigma24 family protein
MGNRDSRDREMSEENTEPNRVGWPKRKGRVARFIDGDESELREFFTYFHPLLLDQARIMGIEADIRDETVLTFLDDKIIELASMDVPPSSLTGYVVRGFRNRVRNLVRDKKTRMTMYSDAASEIGAPTQLIVAECHSEYSANAARGQADEGLGTNHELTGLARFIRSQLSSEDAELLIETARRVPLREIAEWHNISYAACRTRIHRLRNRTHQLTRDYMTTLPRSERTTIERFLRRAGALED